MHTTGMDNTSQFNPPMANMIHDTVCLQQEIDVISAELRGLCKSNVLWNAVSHFFQLFLHQTLALVCASTSAFAPQPRASLLLPRDGCGRQARSSSDLVMWSSQWPRAGKCEQWGCYHNLRTVTQPHIHTDTQTQEDKLTEFSYRQNCHKKLLYGTSGKLNLSIHYSGQFLSLMKITQLMSAETRGTN